ncbi:hypothetical protein [Amphritea japonica]|uniref:hypothetical protein n=1 Tax=Amphritea japonica TaxID=452627 RepID=UPI0003670B38|nr:hypothetical protein [Amphritea japonica]
MESTKWKAILGLVLIYLAVGLQLMWLWGVIILCWVIPDLKSGTTHLFELVSKHQNPWTYWLICLTWIVMAITLLLSPLLSSLKL